MRGGILAYGLALVASATALGLALLVGAIGGDDSIPGLLFLGAVGLSGWYGGFGPALLTAALGALALDYFYESPPFLLQVTSARTPMFWLAFLLTSILLGSLNARLRTSNQRLRLERDRAEAAVLARDELIATVSHDLRTPLTAIKTSVYSLRDAEAQLSEEQRVRLLSNIEAESDRLVHFVRSALALRRLENGLCPNWDWVTACEVTSAALDRLLAPLGPREVTFNVSQNLPQVWVDAALLDQALTVLIENVAVHTPAGSPLALDGSVERGALWLHVSDAGPGIPTQDRARVFEKYERLDRAGSGVGLGLTIARAAVEAQNGHLFVEDSSLGGACFTIEIPQRIVPASRDGP
ncbi:MAG: PAS domain-containing sensor histidine kinase [Chloroflexi bacterium]|nr:PAS domain-containing sensor histidine kinase [Chloroflexota bacterium]